MLEWGGTGLLAVEWDGMAECGVESDMIKVCNVETSRKDNAESTEKFNQKIKKKIWMKGRNGLFGWRTVSVPMKRSGGPTVFPKNVRNSDSRGQKDIHSYKWVPEKVVASIEEKNTGSLRTSNLYLKRNWWDMNNGGKPKSDNCFELKPATNQIQGLEKSAEKKRR